MLHMLRTDRSMAKYLTYDSTVYITAECVKTNRLVERVWVKNYYFPTFKMTVCRFKQFVMFKRTVLIDKLSV